MLRVMRLRVIIKGALALAPLDGGDPAEEFRQMRSDALRGGATYV